MSLEVDNGSPGTRAAIANKASSSIPTTAEPKHEIIIRKVICRYGPGCTHILDPNHRRQFWHPVMPKLNDEELKAQFICNECGYGTTSLPDLQHHLKRKTAWSNVSLIGCRISCLVDLKEWHEGYVTDFHKSGKHLVEFKLVNEQRWLVMKKIAFYIIERPSDNVKDGSEFKDGAVDTANLGLAPIENDWVYCEKISLDYAFAQSVLFKIYGNTIQETGHMTRGHVCITESDKHSAQEQKGSLLYGELLPRGAHKALGPRRLQAKNAGVLFDMGMGTGKLLIQAFLQFKNLHYVYGVELSVGRYKLAELSLLAMVKLLGEENYHVQMNPGKFIIVTEGVIHEPPSDEDSSRTSSQQGDYGERVLHFECGNIFDVQNIDIADIVLMETDFPVELHADLRKLLGAMHESSRVLTYLDLRKVFQSKPTPAPILPSPAAIVKRRETGEEGAGGRHVEATTVLNGTTRGANSDTDRDSHNLEASLHVRQSNEQERLILEGEKALFMQTETAIEAAQCPFKQLDVNKLASDRYPTSWSVQRGHHFFIWRKMPLNNHSNKKRGRSAVAPPGVNESGDELGDRSDGRSSFLLEQQESSFLDGSRRISPVPSPFPSAVGTDVNDQGGSRSVVPPLLELQSKSSRLRNIHDINDEDDGAAADYSDASNLSASSSNSSPRGCVKGIGGSSVLSEESDSEFDHDNDALSGLAHAHVVGSSRCLSSNFNPFSALFRFLCGGHGSNRDGTGPLRHNRRNKKSVAAICHTQQELHGSAKGANKNVNISATSSGVNRIKGKSGTGTGTTKASAHSGARSLSTHRFVDVSTADDDEYDYEDDEYNRNPSSNEGSPAWRGGVSVAQTAIHRQSVQQSSGSNNCGVEIIVSNNNNNNNNDNDDDDDDNYSKVMNMHDDVDNASSSSVAVTSLPASSKGSCDCPDAASPRRSQEGRKSPSILGNAGGSKGHSPRTSSPRTKTKLPSVSSDAADKLRSSAQNNALHYSALLPAVTSAALPLSAKNSASSKVKLARSSSRSPRGSLSPRRKSKSSLQLQIPTGDDSDDLTTNEGGASSGGGIYSLRTKDRVGEVQSTPTSSRKESEMDIVSARVIVANENLYEDMENGTAVLRLVRKSSKKKKTEQGKAAAAAAAAVCSTRVRQSREDGASSEEGRESSPFVGTGGTETPGSPGDTFDVLSPMGRKGGGEGLSLGTTDLRSANTAESACATEDNQVIPQTPVHNSLCSPTTSRKGGDYIGESERSENDVVNDRDGEALHQQQRVVGGHLVQNRNDNTVGEAIPSNNNSPTDNDTDNKTVGKTNATTGAAIPVIPLSRAAQNQYRKYPTSFVSVITTVEDEQAADAASSAMSSAQVSPRSKVKLGATSTSSSRQSSPRRRKSSSRGVSSQGLNAAVALASEVSSGVSSDNNVANDYSNKREIGKHKKKKEKFTRTTSPELARSVRAVEQSGEDGNYGHDVDTSFNHVDATAGTISSAAGTKDAKRVHLNDEEAVVEELTDKQSGNVSSPASVPASAAVAAVEQTNSDSSVDEEEEEELAVIAIVKELEQQQRNSPQTQQGGFK